MNEEEKKAIDFFIHECEKYDGTVEIKGTSVGEETRILNIVVKFLKLAENQQKEIEELTKITKTYNAFPCNKKNQIIIADKEYFDRGLFVKRYISKDKIKEKIKELDNMFECSNEEIDYRLRIEDNAKKQVLEELLEE